MLQFVLLPIPCCLHSKLNQREIQWKRERERFMYCRQPRCRKCCKCCCCCCCMQQELLFDILGSLRLPGQFTAKLLDKTVVHKPAGIATRTRYSYSYSLCVQHSHATAPPSAQSASSAWAVRTKCVARTTFSRILSENCNSERELIRQRNGN